MADQYTPDVIYEIFSRLPIKSLARFQCACKLWLKYINDPYLETIHRVKQEPTMIMFERWGPADRPRFFEISSLRVIQGTMSVKKEPVLLFNHEVSYWYKKHMVLAGSCNGLTLVFIKIKTNSCHGTILSLINPIRKESYNLPPIEIEYTYPKVLAAGAGIDDSTNTLTTVCVIIREPVWSQDIYVVQIQVCTLVHRSGTSSWRKIAQVPPYRIISESIFAHGRLYWLADFYHRPSSEGEGKVVWFDVKKEEFGFIDAPQQNLEIRREKQLVDLNGEVGFACKCKDNGIELWILKQGDQWVLHCDVFGSINALDDVVVSGCWNKDGDILLSSSRRRRLFVYTLKTGDLKRVILDDKGRADVRMYRASLFLIKRMNDQQYKCAPIQSKRKRK